jgi:hypothetical protein
MRSRYAAAALLVFMLPLAVANPVAHDDEYTIYRDQISADGWITLSPSVLANDTDPAGQGLTAQALPGGDNIDLTAAGIVKLHFNPGSFHPGASATDSYRAMSKAPGGGTSNIAQYKVILGNRPPVCRPDNYTVMAGNTLTISGAGVLLNDIDPEKDPLVIKLMPASGGPAHGTLTRVGDSGFRYVPAGDYSGQDTFRYVVTDHPANANPSSYKECTGEVTINVRTASASPSPEVTPDPTISATPQDPTDSPVAPTLAASKPDDGSTGAHWWLYLLGSLVFVAGMIVLVFMLRRRADPDTGLDPTLRFGPGDLR